MGSIEAISKKSVIDYLDRQILICDKALAFSDTSENDKYAMESIKSTLKVFKDFLEGLHCYCLCRSVDRDES